MADTQRQDENRRVALRLIEEAWNKKNFAVLEELVAPEFTGHSPLGDTQEKGPEAFRKMVEQLVAGFPDVQVNVQEIIAEGDRVIIHWEAAGTHKAMLFNLVPTNWKVQISGSTVQRIVNGKLLESWVSWSAPGEVQKGPIVRHLGGS